MPFPKLTFLYTNIGRGHPYYLDGIIEMFVRKGKISLVQRQTSVFDESSGLSLIGWKLARWLYSRGASNGLLGRLYGRIRAERSYNNRSLMLSMLTKSVRQKFSQKEGFAVVAHPTLVAGLKGLIDLSYQHGELVAPNESLVQGASRVFVPTDRVADQFVNSGYKPDQVIVTGLCVEPSLVKQSDDAFAARLERINRQDPLTGLFISSGAEPAKHVNCLVSAFLAAIASGGNVIIMGKQDGQLLQAAQSACLANDIDCEIVGSTDFVPPDLPRVLLVGHQSRREENIFTARLFPYFDYFVGPSHERTNWALGLGLPMFVIGPCIGPFAPRNRQLLLDRGVAVPVDSSTDCRSFGSTLRDMRQTGHLSEMALAGWHKFPIDGFDKIADFLISLIERSHN